MMRIMPRIVNTKLVKPVVLLLILTLAFAGCGVKTEMPANPPASDAPADPSPTGPNDSPAAETNTPDENEIISGLMAKGQEIKEMSYEMVMIGAGLSAESKVWFKDKKLKTDSVFNGQRFISIFDLSQGELVTYLPGDSMATKMKIEEYQGQDHNTPLDYLEELEKADFRPAGIETVNGMECQVVTVISTEGSYKMWLSTQYGLVVKIEGGLDGQGVIEYKNFQIGPGTVAEDTFELPAGMEIFTLQPVSG